MNCFIAIFRRFSAKASRRRAAIEGLYTEDCVLYAPRAGSSGMPPSTNSPEIFRATHPHFVYTPHGEPQALHNAGRLAWGSGPRDEAPDTGLDVIIVRDVKIAALYVFLDSMPSIGWKFSVSIRRMGPMGLMRPISPISPTAISRSARNLSDVSSFLAWATAGLKAYPAVRQAGVGSKPEELVPQRSHRALPQAGRCT